MSQEHGVITEHLHPKSIFLQRSALVRVSKGDPVHFGKSVIGLYRNWAFRTDSELPDVILTGERYRVPGKSPIDPARKQGFHRGDCGGQVKTIPKCKSIFYNLDIKHPKNTVVTLYSEIN